MSITEQIVTVQHDTEMKPTMRVKLIRQLISDDVEMPVWMYAEPTRKDQSRSCAFGIWNGDSLNA